MECRSAPIFVHIYIYIPSIIAYHDYRASRLIIYVNNECICVNNIISVHILHLRGVLKLLCVV